MDAVAKPAGTHARQVIQFTGLTLVIVAVAVCLGWFISGAVVRAAGATWFMEGWIALGACAGFLFTAFKTRRGRVVEHVGLILFAITMAAYPLVDELSGRSFQGY